MKRCVIGETINGFVIEQYDDTGKRVGFISIEGEGSQTFQNAIEKWIIPFLGVK